MRIVNWGRCCCLVFLFFAATGCTHFKQTHYVGVVNEKTGSLQFYRFRLTGRPGLTLTKFHTGWYSADAIDSLLGEKGFSTPSRPSAGKSKDNNEDGDKKENTDTSENNGKNGNGNGYRDSEQYLVTGPEGQGFPIEEKRFTIIMSSDPEPITGAITKLANDESLKKLIDDQVEKAKKKKEEEEAEKKKRQEFIVGSLKASCNSTDPKVISAIKIFEVSLGEKICDDKASQPGGGN